MSALQVAKGQTEYQNADLGREKDEPHDSPEYFIDDLFDGRSYVYTGQTHGNHGTQHAEDGTDPYQPVEAQEDGRVGGVELETSPLEQDTEKDEENEIRNENQDVPQANTGRRWEVINTCVWLMM